MCDGGVQFLRRVQADYRLTFAPDVQICHDQDLSGCWSSSGLHSVLSDFEKQQDVERKGIKRWLDNKSKLYATSEL
jgi:hypothetical protein